MNYFEELNNVNVSDKVEKKNGLSYVSWPVAWAEVKKRHPTAFYTIYENEHGWNYFTDGKTAWVKTGVTIEVKTGDVNEKGELENVTVYPLEHIEYLPVMDFKNKSIPLEQVTSMDVNKAIQRSLTKACARHGLGLYIYAGEDLPEEEAKQLQEVISDKEVKLLEAMCKRKGQDAKAFKGKKFKELTGAEYAEAVKALGKLPDVAD